MGWSFQVCPGRSRRCAASRCVQEGVDDVQLPGVSRKEGRRFADSRCVQEGEAVLTALPGVSRKASRLFAASRCVQEG